jgi:hypothetical protein
LRAACRSPAMTCVCISCVVVTGGQDELGGVTSALKQQRG